MLWLNNEFHELFSFSFMYFLFVAIWNRRYPIFEAYGTQAILTCKIANVYKVVFLINVSVSDSTTKVCSLTV